MQTQEGEQRRRNTNVMHIASKSLAYATKSSPWTTKWGLKKCSDITRQCVSWRLCISLAQIYFHQLWPHQSFTLCQAIYAFIQFIWMDAQRHCIWRTVSSSLRHTTRCCFAFFHTHTHTHTHTHIVFEREHEKASQCCVLVQPAALCLLSFGSFDVNDWEL